MKTITGITVALATLVYFMHFRTFIADLPNRTNADGLRAIGLMLAIAVAAGVLAALLAGSVTRAGRRVR